MVTAHPEAQANQGSPVPQATKVETDLPALRELLDSTVTSANPELKEQQEILEPTVLMATKDLTDSPATPVKLDPLENPDHPDYKALQDNRDTRVIPVDQAETETPEALAPKAHKANL